MAASGSESRPDEVTVARPSLLGRLVTIVGAGAVGGVIVLAGIRAFAPDWFVSRPEAGPAALAEEDAARLAALETVVAALPQAEQAVTARRVEPTMTLRIAARGAPSPTRARARALDESSDVAVSSPAPPSATAEPSATDTSAPSDTPTRPPTRTPAPTRTSRPTATLRILP